jgi:hypothetical protein
VTLQVEQDDGFRSPRRRISLLSGLTLSSSISAIIVVGLCSLIATASATETQAEDAATTIVLVRHAEKPEDGLGQLNCQGLNRALALTPVIAKSFGRPDAIYAPNPSHQKEDAGKPYDYIRPLATIEPTAIYFGLPVDVSLDFRDIEGLRTAIEKRRAPNHSTFFLIGWEHRQIAGIARSFLAAHGADAATTQKVKDWDGKDFDGMFVVTITEKNAAFDQKYQGLNGQPTACPY